MDGNELKVRCKYCNLVVYARYQQLFKHSVSSKHLSNAAAATTLSFPTDIVSNCCKATNTCVHLSQDEERVTDAEGDRINAVADESTDADWRSSNIQHFDDDLSFTEDGAAVGCRKVGHYLCFVLCFYSTLKYA